METASPAPHCFREHRLKFGVKALLAPLFSPEFTRKSRSSCRGAGSRMLCEKRQRFFARCDVVRLSSFLFSAHISLPEKNRPFFATTQSAVV
jgi:hypothetical protein